MRAFSPSILLVAGVALGLLSGCARPTQTAQGNTGQPTPQASPPRSVVTSEDIDRNPGQPIERVLEGRFPGVIVTRTADGISVLIRGGSSLLGSNVPLYVLDGIIIDPGPNGTLTGINPRDIESIEVLKDPASTTMYGMRGANGVIVIRTKRPPQ
jgi:TonB-dependent SusC/RagA subfamily outer membrane receptor